MQPQSCVGVNMQVKEEGKAIFIFWVHEFTQCILKVVERKEIKNALKSQKKNIDEIVI